MTHAWIEDVDLTGKVVNRGAVDKSRTDAQRFTVYRVRFQLVNDGDSPVSLVPRLEVTGGPTSWVLVPTVDPVQGVPFYAASDEGRVFEARHVPIDAAALRLASPGGQATPAEGVSSAGENPLPPLTLPAHAYTEVEFAVRATVDAEWTTAYSFRLADAGGPSTPSRQASIVMSGKPGLHLSPGQRPGRSVGDPLPRYPLAFSGVDTPAGRDVVPATYAALSWPIAAAGSFGSPHMGYTLTTDACAACHTAHQGKSAYLLNAPQPQSTLCFECHDGTGATSNVQADFTSTTLPTNDPSTSSWYSHPATASSSPDSTDEPFAGVLNRRAICSDCHQPHLADATRPVMTTAGWTAGGAIGGASGVTVTNNAAGSAPAYAFAKTVTLEYELCFKCHSGYTVLPAQDPAHPSRWALDKGIELNPANVSYHPVEAAGRNQTTAMSTSLSGTSPYKLWSLDTSSTVRCENCHGNSDVATPSSPPSADAVLDNHAGPNRGILIAPYRDRVLLGNLDMYNAANFALCYVCHAEAPMVDGTGDVRTDTNFNWHGLHLNEIWLNGTGNLDIDTPGAGQGNATCAECHFRIHGTALAYGGQTPARGLVNFAPDVQPLNGTLKFVPWAPGTPGSCTLTCHGRAHNGFSYEGVP